MKYTIISLVVLLSACSPWDKYEVTQREKYTIEKVCEVSNYPRNCIRDATDQLKQTKWYSDKELSTKSAHAAYLSDIPYDSR